MKRIGLFAALAAMLVLVGCSKDKSFYMLVSTENYHSSNKAYINNNNYACWENGDDIRITIPNRSVNNTEAITVSHAGGQTTCSVSGELTTPESGDTVRAGYPASMFGSGVNSGSTSSTTSITMPATYTYSTTSGNQKLEAPMVASLTYGTNENNLKFKNICALLKVHLTATANAATVDYVEVKRYGSDNTTPKQMSGTATLTYNGHEPTLTMSGTASADNNSVRLNMGTNAIALNSTTSADVYIPIPPLDNGDRIEIIVHNALHSGNGDGCTTKQCHVTHQNGVPGNLIIPIEATPIDEASDYTFYDYLQNNGNASICLHESNGQTPLRPDNQSKMEITFKILSNHVTGSQYYSGSRDGANGTINFSISGSTNDTYFRSSFLGSSVASTMQRAAGTKYRHSIEIMHDNDGYYGYVTFSKLDGNNNVTEIETARTSSNANGFTSTAAPVYVFGYNTSNKNQGMQLYSYRIWKDVNGTQTLVHNFVPAKNSSDAIGLYDMVGNSFISVSSDHFSVYNDSSSN